MRTQADKNRTRPAAAGAATTAQRQVAGLPAVPGNSLQLRQLQASQAVLDGSPHAARLSAVQMQAQPNRTGLPDQLKAGIEHLSGMAMDGVRVHYNSAKPAQLQALAYAQGSDIHLAPGQERHLPHEAWHVVQQKQGRVRATMQMQAGMAINDDAGLEREADVMGAKAAVVAQRAGGELLQQGATPAQLVAQRFVAPYDITGNTLFGAVVRNERPYTWSLESWRLLRSAVMDMDWVSLANTAYQLIRDSREVVEDDDDELLLDGYESGLDKLVKSGNKLIPKFNRADSARLLPVAYELEEVRKAVTRLLAGLTSYFRPAGGGFGALGRATEVADRKVIRQSPPRKKSKQQQPNMMPPTLANRFIGYTTLNGKAMTDTHYVKGGQGVQAQAGPINLMAGGYYGAANIIENEDAVDQQLASIPKPLEQVKNASSNFVAVDRGLGQAAAMKGTNARGYAWYNSIAGWDTTQWEWLHLRGAGLGGRTDGTNLVLGTRDANTLMMPYESHLRALQIVAKDSGDYTGVKVTWKPFGRENRHAYKEIHMWWETPRTVQGVDNDEPVLSGKVIIHPLASTGVLSKAEVRHIEQALLSIRNSVRDEMEID